MMLAIYGPTATGKTALGIKLAKKYNGELISADSRQVYKGLDIGSGKVNFSSKVEKHRGYWIVDGAKIHGFDLINPEKRFTVADFLKFAHRKIVQITEVGKLPIIVGGTGFYIKALVDGIESIGIPEDPKLRRKIEKLSTDELYQKLVKLDQNRARSINESDRKNPRRLIRAIEIASYKKYQVSTFSFRKSSIRYQENTKYEIPNTKYLIIGLTAPNEFLFRKADTWLMERIDHGLIDEVKGLLKERVDAKWLEDLGLEYRWITRYLARKSSYEQSILRLKGDIHSFVRRQKTWFKQFKDIHLFDVSKKNHQALIEKTVGLWYTKENERRKVIASH